MRYHLKLARREDDVENVYDVPCEVLPRVGEFVTRDGVTFAVTAVEHDYARGINRVPDVLVHAKV